MEEKLTVFERVHVWMLQIESNILIPLLIVSLMTVYSSSSSSLLFTTLFGFRLARSGYAQPQLMYMPLSIAFIASAPWDDDYSAAAAGANSPSPSNNSLLLFLVYILVGVWPKVAEFFLKLNFIACYSAPWQISWGSAFHAFAQPFSVPHTGLILAQAAISSLLSAPLNPFLGSSFFLLSYVRPIKFWLVVNMYGKENAIHSKSSNQMTFDS